MTPKRIEQMVGMHHDNPTRARCPFCGFSRVGFYCPNCEGVIT